MSYQPVAFLTLRPFVGSDRGFAFLWGEPPAAFVLDPWSFTILSSLENADVDEVRSQLYAGDPDETAALADALDQTLSHLAGLGLIDEVIHDT